MIQLQDFRKWNGLPSDCDWTTITGPLPQNWEDVFTRSLGSSYQRAQKIQFELPGYIDPSMAFVNRKPVLFEAMGPELVEFEALLNMLGKPTAKLDWDFGSLPMKASEYVYPSKGITLFLRHDLDKAIHIALYASTTLNDYLVNLRPHFGSTKMPSQK